MKLYYAKGACSLAIRILINELNLSADFEAVDLKSKKTSQGTDFYLINPKGAVPVLELDNGEVLTENAVILQYLVDTHKAFSLLPSIGDFERYRVLEWVNYITTELHKSFSLLFNQAFSEEIKHDIITPIIKSKLKFVNQHLQNQEYLLGEQFRLPDIYLFVVLSWAPFFKIDLQEYHHLIRYIANLKKRPAFLRSLQEEGLAK